MSTVTIPYKLQVFLSDELRQALKDMAHRQHSSLQALVVTILENAVAEEARPRRPPVPSGVP